MGPRTLGMSDVIPNKTNQVMLELMCCNISENQANSVDMQTINSITKTNISFVCVKTSLWHHH